MKFNNVFLVLAFSVILSGCIAPKSYVDPKYGDINYTSLKKVASQYKSTINVEFQRNGKHMPAVDKELRAQVERVLSASGVVTPSTQSEPISIKVVCNNIADLKAAGAKGFGTGLTFGAVGTAVSDYYQVTVTFAQGDKVTEKKYDHAIHTTIGNKEAPVQGVAPTKPAEAFGGVVEDVILQFIKEMQDANTLTLNETSKRQG